MAQNKQTLEVVVARFSAIGDVAMCIPVLYGVCISYPGLHFTFITRKEYTDIFINPPENLVVRGIDLDNDYKGLGGLRKLAGEFSGAEMFIDQHNVLRTRILSFLLKLKGVNIFTLDKGRKYKKRMVKEGAMGLSPLKSTLQRYDETFLQVPLFRTSHFDGLYASTPADASLFASVSAPKADGERWVGFAPFAAHPSKIYPLDKMRQVVDTIAQQPNTKIFLFGGGDAETQILQEWATSHQNIVCVSGSRLGFAGELSLMHYLNVMVCMDSANMHLAAITGTRTLSIWGATHPSAGFIAWRSNAADCIGVQLDCRPCSIYGNKPCKFGNHNCMNSIKTKDIIAQINNIIGHE